MKPMLVRWRDAELASYSIMQAAIPKGQVIRMTLDVTFSDSYIVDIINVVVTSTNIGAGILKLL